MMRAIKPAFAQIDPARPLAGMTLTDTETLLSEHKLPLSEDLVHQLHAETASRLGATETPMLAESPELFVSLI